MDPAWILLVPDERVIIYEISGRDFITFSDLYNDYLSYFDDIAEMNEKPMPKIEFKYEILYATQNRFSNEKIVFGNKGRRRVCRGIFLDTLIPNYNREKHFGPNVKVIKQT